MNYYTPRHAAATPNTLTAFTQRLLQKIHRLITPRSTK